MTVLFDGVVGLSYSQIYVISNQDTFIDGFEDALDGQQNGLCQAGTPGLLFLVTGTHTGRVRFAVELLEDEPELTDEWEEVVETSFRPLTTEVTLTEWGAGDSWPLTLPIRDYRVRYSAAGLDVGSDDYGPEDDADYEDYVWPDRYLLQFWPASPGPDAILRQTSQTASYWHGEAGGRP